MEGSGMKVELVAKCTNFVKHLKWPKVLIGKLLVLY